MTGLLRVVDRARSRWFLDLFIFLVFLSRSKHEVCCRWADAMHTAATLMKENVSKEHKAEKPKVHPARDTAQTAYWAKFPEFSLLMGF
jgi:hypothetical protein